VEYVPVNLERIADFEEDVTPESLVEAGIINKVTVPIVILGDGDLDRALNVRAHRFSATAKAKIEAAGGVAEVLPLGM
jgi:large subunit ribosomal protein L15